MLRPISRPPATKSRNLHTRTQRSAHAQGTRGRTPYENSGIRSKATTCTHSQYPPICTCAHKHTHACTQQHKHTQSHTSTITQAHTSAYAHTRAHLYDAAVAIGAALVALLLVDELELLLLLQLVDARLEYADQILLARCVPERAYVMSEPSVCVYGVRGGGGSAYQS